MRQTLHVVLLITVWLVASTVIAHLWVTNPSAFPSLPSSLWAWADAHYQTGNAEEIADLEFIVTFAVSAASVVSGCALGYSVWRKLRSAHRQRK